MAEWLGELRGDDAPHGDQARHGDFGVGAAPAAETVVPALGREVRQNRRSAAKARKADAKARKADGGEDVVRPGGFDDLDAPDRGRLLSLLVFWAPALILLLLAGIVIWLVR
jgi:hypothetical protein